MKFEGKVAVVSGGGSGIGRAAVLALTWRVTKVVVADIDTTGGERTVHIAAPKGGTAVFTLATSQRAMACRPPPSPACV